MKITKGVALFLFLIVLTAGMAGTATATTAEIYADTSSIGTAETGITYTIPVNVSACGQKLTGFTIDIPRLVDANGNAYADITVKFMEDPDEPSTLIPVPADSAVGRKGSYESNIDNPTRIVWYYSRGVTISDETILFYLNVTINGSMKYPGSSIPVNVLPTEWSVDGALSDDKTNVTKYISVNYPASEPVSVEITEPTGSLAYNAEGTAAAKVYDQYGNEMTADLTWISSDPTSLEFTDATAGTYHVISCAAGSVTITASAGDVAEKVVVPLTKATPTGDEFEITVPENVVYDGKTHNVTAVAKSEIYGMGTVTVLYGGETSAPTDAGSYTITLNVAEGDNYTAKDGVVTGKTLTIKQASLTMGDFDYNLTAVPYDGKEHPVAVTLNESISGAGTPVTVTYNGSTNAPVNAGEYEVKVSVPAGTNYEAVSDLSLGTFTIEKAVPTKDDFSYTIKSPIVYDGQPHTVDVTSTNITAFTVAYISNGTAVTAPTGYGIYVVNVTVKDDVNYQNAELTLGQFEITKTLPTEADFRYTEPSASDLVYSKTAKNASVTTTISELQGKFDVKYYQGDVETSPIAIGTYDVVVVTQATANYAATNITVGSFAITAKEISSAVVSLVESSFIYNAAPQTVSVSNVTISPGWVLEITDYNISGDITQSSVGEYTLTITGVGNYTGTASASWNITAKDLSGAVVTLSNTSVEYTGSEQTVTVVSVEVNSSIIPSSDYTVSGDLAKTAVGEYTVNVTGIGNYTGIASANWNITKATPTAADFIYNITSQIEYDGLPHTVNVTSSKITDGTITVTYNGASEAPVSYGTYLVNVSVSGATNYKDASNINLGQFEITKTLPKAVDFTYTSPVDLVYSKTAKEASVTTTISELQGNFTVKYCQGSVETSPVAVGTYDVVAVTQATANYAATNVTVGNFTITRKPIADAEVVLDKTTLEYNVTEQTVSVTAVTLSESWGLDSADYNVSGNSAAAVGQHTVTVTGKGNYAGTASAVWNITAKDISSAVVTLSNTSVVYTGSEQTVTVESVVLDAPYGTLSAADYLVSGDLTKTAVGKYTVTITGKGNYTGNVTADWNITKAVPTAADFAAKDNTSPITFPLNIDYDNAEHTVTVTNATGIDGMGEITGVSYWNISSGVEENPKKVGAYNVTVSTADGTNYEAVSDLLLGVININGKNCTITYVTNGGTAISPETYKSGVETKVLNTTTTRDGYKFEGWYADDKFLGVKVIQITPEEFGDKTFYANWTVNTTTKTVVGNTTDINEKTAVKEGGSNKVTSIVFDKVSGVNGTVIFTADNTSLSSEPPAQAGKERIVISVFNIDAELADSETPASFNVTIELENADDKNKVVFWHFNTANNKWDEKPLKSKIVSEEGKKITYNVETTSFSPFGITIESVIQQSAPSHSSSSRNDGYSVWFQPTAEPTPVPTQAAEPTQGVPSVSPIDQPQTQTSTPAPFLGILAGLGAAGLLFTLRRK